MRNFSKMTMLLFVAAAMFAFASCDKEDDASIKESQLVGKWYWKAARGTIEIKANHEARLNGIEYNWTLKGNRFNAIHDNYVSYENIDVEIKSISSTEMVVEGILTETYYASSDTHTRDVTDTLRRVQ